MELPNLKLLWPKKSITKSHPCNEGSMTGDPVNSSCIIISCFYDYTFLFQRFYPGWISLTNIELSTVLDATSSNTSNYHIKQLIMIGETYNYLIVQIY